MDINPYKVLLDEITLNSYDIISSDDSLLINITKCSFIRNIEFNDKLQRIDTELYYFLLPFLRGLVEDLIVLNYINKIIAEEDKKDFIGYFMLRDVEKSVDRQSDFFSYIRNHQPHVTQNILKTIHSENYFKNKFLLFKDKYGWRRKEPTVFEMANSGGLRKIYEYFYHATSRLVHFNPHLLMKMGWGQSKSLNPSDLNIATYKASTSNFNDYYEAFCIFYGNFIFIKFIDLLSSNIKISDMMNFKINEIRTSLNDNRRWPELITFEELNISVKNGIQMYDLEKGGVEQLMSRMMQNILKKDSKKKI